MREARELQQYTYMFVFTIRSKYDRCHNMSSRERCNGGNTYSSQNHLILAPLDDLKFYSMFEVNHDPILELQR